MVKAEMKIQKVTDDSFRKYGRVISEYDFTELVEAMRQTPVSDEVVYEPGVAKLEALEISKVLQERYYGEMPIQVGFCNGKNFKLNALEYHRSSEVDVAATDAILLLGRQQDIDENWEYDTAKAEAFLISKGTAVELYATTLHYAPCSVGDEYFRMAIVLPKGTNYPLAKEHEGVEDGHLTAVNKWLFGHAEGGLPEGSPISLTGKNLDVRE